MRLFLVCNAGATCRPDKKQAGLDRPDGAWGSNAAVLQRSANFVLPWVLPAGGPPVSAWGGFLLKQGREKASELKCAFL